MSIFEGGGNSVANLLPVSVLVTYSI